MSETLLCRENARWAPVFEWENIPPGVFLFGGKTDFSKLERREIYDIVIKRVERIMTSMNQVR